MGNRLMANLECIPRCSTGCFSFIVFGAIKRKHLEFSVKKKRGSCVYNFLGQPGSGSGSGPGSGPSVAAARCAAALSGPGPDPDPGPGPEIFQLSGRPRYSVPGHPW